jgi:SH3-like domain-containing protein
MRELVLDQRGKVPRFVIFEDAVVNQRDGREQAYTVDWVPAYITLRKQWKREQGNDKKYMDNIRLTLEPR